MKAKWLTALVTFSLTVWLYQGKNPCKTWRHNLTQFQQLDSEINDWSTLQNRAELREIYDTLQKTCEALDPRARNSCAEEGFSAQQSEQACQKLKGEIKTQLFAERISALSQNEASLK